VLFVSGVILGLVIEKKTQNSQLRFCVLFVQLSSVDRGKWVSTGSISNTTGILRGLFCFQISLHLVLALNQTTKAVSFDTVKRVKG